MATETLEFPIDHFERAAHRTRLVGMRGPQNFFHCTLYRRRMYGIGFTHRSIGKILNIHKRET